MSKFAISIYVLIALLVGTNAMWLYRTSHEVSASSISVEMHCKPTEESAQIYDSIVLPLTDAIAAAAKPGATKESIVQAANSAGIGTNRICMEDREIIRVRGVGFRINDNGHLTGATVANCPW